MSTISNVSPGAASAPGTPASSAFAALVRGVAVAGAAPGRQRPVNVLSSKALTELGFDKKSGMFAGKFPGTSFTVSDDYGFLGYVKVLPYTNRLELIYGMGQDTQRSVLFVGKDGSVRAENPKDSTKLTPTTTQIRQIEDVVNRGTRGIPRGSSEQGN